MNRKKCIKTGEFNWTIWLFLPSYFISQDSNLAKKCIKTGKFDWTIPLFLPSHMISQDSNFAMLRQRPIKFC